MRTLTRVITTYAVVKKSTYVTTLAVTPARSNSMDDGNSMTANKSRNTSNSKNEKTTGRQHSGDARKSTDACKSTVHVL